MVLEKDLMRTLFTVLFLTSFRMGPFRAAQRWAGGCGGGQNVPLPKICHIYPTMMKLDTLIPYLKKIQKIYKSHD